MLSKNLLIVVWNDLSVSINVDLMQWTRPGRNRCAFLCSCQTFYWQTSEVQDSKYEVYLKQIKSLYSRPRSYLLIILSRAWSIIVIPKMDRFQVTGKRLPWLFFNTNLKTNPHLQNCAVFFFPREPREPPQSAITQNPDKIWSKSSWISTKVERTNNQTQNHKTRQILIWKHISKPFDKILSRW